MRRIKLVYVILTVMLVIGCSKAQTISTKELLTSDIREKTEQVIFYPGSHELTDPDLIISMFSLLDSLTLTETGPDNKDGSLILEFSLNDGTSERLYLTSKKLVYNNKIYKCNKDICDDLRVLFGLEQE